MTIASAAWSIRLDCPRDRSERADERAAVDDAGFVYAGAAADPDTYEGPPAISDRPFACIR